MRKTYLPFILSIIAGVLLLLIPVLGEFHLFSASLAAIIGAFWGGIHAARLKNLRNHPTSGIRELGFITLVVLSTGIPLLIGAFFRGCFSSDGLMFWLLLPMPSVFLGFSIGRYINLNAFKRPRFFSVLMISAVLFGTLLAELYLFPQVFFYNHIFGYFPGPIYDDAISFRPALLVFRYMTFAWAVIIWLMPSFRKMKSVRLPLLLATLSLMLCYTGASRVGINSPESHIQRTLGATIQTEHFHIYFDRRIPEKDIRYLAGLHEFHFSELQQKLQTTAGTEKLIRSYIYLHEWQKKELTGAGATSYVPVWNPNPQMHMHVQVAPPILRHELTHVLAREFGLPVINASPNMALIEGVATALESQRNIIATRDELVAGLDSLPDIRYMKDLMSITGFYKKHGSISYTVAGSFTGWLLSEIEPNDFKNVYRTGQINRSGVPFDSLISGWHRHLESISVDSTQIAMSQRLFSLPGITEISCPFIQGREQRAMDEASRFLALKDTSAASSVLEKFVESGRNISPQTALLHAELILHLQKPDHVISFLIEQDFEHEQLKLVLADALFLTDDIESARQIIQSEITDSLSLHIRSSDEIWGDYLRIRYGNQSIKPDEISSNLFPFYLSRIVQSDWEVIILPEKMEQVDFVNPIYFLASVRYVDYLIKLEQWDTARGWVDVLASESLPNARERILNERLRIITFLEQNSK